MPTVAQLAPHFGVEMESILQYVEAFHLEKKAGYHTTDNPCNACQPNYQPASSSFITRERRLAIKQRDNFRCWVCNADLSSSGPDNQTMDHLISLEEYAHLIANPDSAPLMIWFGSKHKTGNLALACKACNSKRKNQSFLAFAISNGIECCNRALRVIKSRKPLAIEQSKRAVGNNRRTYKNAWVTRQRLSQGIGT